MLDDASHVDDFGVQPGCHLKMEKRRWARKKMWKINIKAHEWWEAWMGSVGGDGSERSGSTAYIGVLRTFICHPMDRYRSVKAAGGFHCDGECSAFFIMEINSFTRSPATFLASFFSLLFVIVDERLRYSNTITNARLLNNAELVYHSYFQL